MAEWMKTGDRIGSGDGVLGGTARPIIQSRTALAMLALATIAVIGYVDFLSGTELSVGLLYLIPCAAAAWYVGPSAGRVTAVAATAAKIAADLYTVDAHLPPAIPIWNAATVLVLALGMVEVFDRLRRVLASERELARTDELTGLANARALHEIAELEIERLRRYGRPLTVASLDLDHFKDVNDTKGHAAGDRLLKDVAEVLRGSVRRVDAVARMGGDEFTILLPETSAEAVLHALDHVRQAMSSIGAGYGPGVRASFGAVTYSQAPVSVEAMLHDADRAMYLAKGAGRDRIESVRMPQEAARLRTVGDDGPARDATPRAAGTIEAGAAPSAEATAD